jgi:DNA-binding MarR family transcriptional regulator
LRLQRLDFGERFCTIPETLAVSSVLRQPGSIPSPAVTETGDEPPTHHLPGLTDAERQCWEQFLESSTLLLERLDRTLRDVHNVALADFLVLDALARSANGSARMKDLSQAAVLRPSRVTEQISRLESQGLVRRTPSADDGRGVITTITREGLALVKPAARTYIREIRTHYFDPMTRQQMISLGDACRWIGDALTDRVWPTRPKPH